MMTPEERRKRDVRAQVIAELLRMGHSPASVSEAVKIADAGGSVYDAMAALSRPRTTETPA